MSGVTEQPHHKSMFTCSASGLIWQTVVISNNEEYITTFENELQARMLWRILGPKESVVDYLSDRNNVYVQQLSSEECEEVGDYIELCSWFTTLKKKHPQASDIKYWWSTLKGDTRVYEYGFTVEQIDDYLCRMRYISEDMFKIIPNAIL